MSCACGLAKLHQLVEYSHFMCTSRCFILLCTYVEYLLFVIRTSTRTGRGGWAPRAPFIFRFYFPPPPHPLQIARPPTHREIKNVSPRHGSSLCRAVRGRARCSPRCGDVNGVQWEAGNGS